MLQYEILKEELNDSASAPRHVAIIMDGNRRWAYKRLKNPSWGHENGATIVQDIVRKAKDLGISTLTLFAFSTENWKRSKTEVEILFSIFQNHLNKMKDDMVKEGVRLLTIGNLKLLPLALQKLIQEVKDETKENHSIDLVLALNYGARDELKRAFGKIIEDIEEGIILKEQISEGLITSYLDTYMLPDPDLVIRTSGEKRMSNFLLWQAAYAEFYTTDVFWPDFTPEELERAVAEYSRRQRRKGA
jgi:undecaprenyl diphosphate synthase